jgi:hypothetical protein
MSKNRKRYDGEFKLNFVKLVISSKEVRRLLNKYGLKQSMGRTGNCYDNSAVESFFHTLKVEGDLIKDSKPGKKLLFVFLNILSYFTTVKECIQQSII